jgi:hypothetical protein
VAKPPIGTNVDETLDVHRNFAPEVALNAVIAIDHFTKAADLIVGQVANARVRADSRFRQDLLAGGQTDSEDIGKSDFNALFAR